jgi:hypothetical protein
MKKAHVLALTCVLIAISWIQPASAATLQVVNKTTTPALVTITYHTNFCKDDRGEQVAPVGTFTPAGASTYAVTANAALKNRYVNSRRP